MHGDRKTFIAWLPAQTPHAPWLSIRHLTGAPPEQTSIIKHRKIMNEEARAR